MPPKTNEEWVEEFKEIYGDYLEGYFCCSGRDCACNGTEVDSEAYRWLRTLFTEKDKEREEAVAEARVEIVSRFKQLCNINVDGDCKYFRDDIHEQLLRGDKFVAQKILEALTQPTQLSAEDSVR